MKKQNNGIEYPEIYEDNKSNFLEENHMKENSMKSTVPKKLISASASIQKPKLIPMPTARTKKPMDMYKTSSLKEKTFYYYKTKKGCYLPIGYLLEITKENINNQMYFKYVFTKYKDNSNENDKIYNEKNEFSKLTLLFKHEDDVVKYLFEKHRITLQNLDKNKINNGGKKTLHKRKNKKQTQRKRNTRKTHQ